jgi:hypothetical protein
MGRKRVKRRFNQGDEPCIDAIRQRGEQAGQLRLECLV